MLATNGKKKKKTLTKPVRAFKMDNDKHLSQPIPRLQFVGRNRTIWFPGSGPNPVHSETGGWQTDVCSPQLQFCLSGWIRSSFIVTLCLEVSEQRAMRAHGGADRPSSL